MIIRMKLVEIFEDILILFEASQGFTTKLVAVKEKRVFIYNIKMNKK